MEHQADGEGTPKPIRFIPLVRHAIAPPQNKFDEIAALVEASKLGKKEAKDIDLGVVPNHQAQMIKENAVAADNRAVITNGFKKKMSVEAISHTLKRHGDDRSETERGQKGVTETDFKEIPGILVSPDTVRYGGKNSFKQDSILFVKKVKQYTYYVVMAVREKKRELSFTTMYIKR